MSAVKRWTKAVNKGKTTAGLDEWVEQQNFPVTLSRRMFLLMWFGLFWLGVAFGLFTGIVVAVLT